MDAGRVVIEARLARGWTIRRLASEACLSAATVYAVEAGRPASVETYVRLAVALGLHPAISLDDRRRRPTGVRDEDPVHAAMTETIADRLHGRGFQVATDEPYQHFQFAGRADLVAWDIEAAALLHCEQRTRLPNVQDTAGTFNAKRAYLADALAKRLGLQRNFRSVTHVIVLLWSSEVLHTLRLRPETFRALAPDGAAPFDDWWSGSPPAGLHTGLVVFDPVPGGRTDRRRWIDLEQALTVRPRYRGMRRPSCPSQRRTGMTGSGDAPRSFRTQAAVATRRPEHQPRRPQSAVAAAERGRGRIAECPARSETTRHDHRTRSCAR